MFIIPIPTTHVISFQFDRVTNTYLKMFDLSSKVLQDLELLATLDSSTISEFCKLAIEQLAKLYLLDPTEDRVKSENTPTPKFIISHKMLESAVKKLKSSNPEISADSISSSLQAIANMYTESAKENISPDVLAGFLEVKV